MLALVTAVLVCQAQLADAGPDAGEAGWAPGSAPVGPLPAPAATQTDEVPPPADAGAASPAAPGPWSVQPGAWSLEPGAGSRPTGAEPGARPTSADAGLTPDAGPAEEDERRRTTVITGSRTERRQEDAVVSTEVVTRPQLEAMGVRDLPQLLQQQPGVELVYTNRSVGVRLQGLDPEYTLVLIDGQRVAGRAGPATDVSRFTLREVERVEIVKGPAAAVYGADAIGGVINLITRRPTRPFEATVRGMFGTLLEGDVRANVGSKLGPFEIRAGGGYRTRNAYDWDPKDVATSLPSQKRGDGDVELAYAPSDKLRLWLRSGYQRMDLAGVDLNDTGAVFDRRQRTEQFDVWTGGKGVPWTGGTLTVRGHFGLFRDQFQLDQRFSRALDDYTQSITREYEAYAQLDQRLGAHQLSAGLEGISEALYSSRLDPRLVSRLRGAVFLQDEWSSSPAGARLAVLPGFRVDLDSQFGAAPSPRLAVKVDPSPALTLRAAWGLGFRPPTFSELYLRFANPGIGYIVQGNPRLTAEHSGSITLAVDWRPPVDGWVVSASLWHTSLSNLINVTAAAPPNPDNPTTFNYENVANAYTQGVELSVRLKLFKSTFLDLGYLGMDARDLTRNRPLEGRAPHRVTGQLTWKYRPIGLESLVRASWVAARPYYLGQGGGGITNVLGFGEGYVALAPAYVDLELQVSWTWRWVKIFVNAYNLLNNGDATFNPRPPRGVLGGVQLEY